MGCDIHCTWEVRKDGVWENQDEFKEEPWGPSVTGREILWKRNYRLFAMLANVRNGYGVAGSDTGDGLEPIAEPRGIPEDAAEITKRWAEDLDGHSRSHHTLAQLLSYDLTRKTTLRGFVNAREFHLWDGHWRNEGESPKSWSSGVWGPKIRKVEEEEMRELLLLHVPKGVYGKELDEHLDAEPLQHVYTHCEWDRFYWQLAGELTEKAIPIMLAAKVPYDDVRIVFYFDN